MKNTALFLLFIIGTSLSSLQAQNKRIIDSLRNEVKLYDALKLTMGNNAAPLMDSNKALVLFAIENYFCKFNADSTMSYAQELLELSQKIGYKKGIGAGYGGLGVAYYMKGNLEKGLENNQKALAIRLSINDKKNIAVSYGNIGNDYLELGNLPLAAENYLASLKINEELGNRSGLANSYINLSSIYYHEKNYREALKYSLLGIRITKEIGDTISAGRNLQYAGGCLMQMHKYDSSIVVETQGFNVAERFGDSLQIPGDENNIGANYFWLHDYNNALKWYLASFNSAVKCKDTETIGIVYTNIGWLDEEMGNNIGSVNDETKGISMLTKFYKSPHLTLGYDILAKAYSKLGNYKGAYEAELLFEQSKDSDIVKNNDNKVSGLLLQYKFDKHQDSLNAAAARQEDSIRTEQNKKNAIAQKEIQNQKNIKYALLAGLILVLAFAGFVVRSLRLSRKQRIEIEKEKQRAEQSEKFKEQFLANMSHEIRTPMNAVNGMTELLLEKKHLPEQVKYLEAIRKSSDTLLHIINDILDLSKIEAGKMEIEKIDFSLKDTVEQVRQTLSFRAEEKGLQLIIQIDNSIPEVLVGDPVRLNQVLMNLGGNAIKFTVKGSVSITVKQSKIPTPFGNVIQFTIADTGIGIPKDKMPKVFESFSQANTSDSRKFGGTGLGLSISKQLVELQGGRILLESEEGVGTTFSFTLNYPTGSKERFERSLNTEHQIDGSVFNGLRILIADDNEYNRIVAKDTLQLKAFVQVDEAENGEQVLQQLEKHRYDVILMDVQMPVMDGYEATQQIRNNFPSPKNNTPIIALTASVIRTDLEKCKQAGMNTYVPKPFKARQLFSAIAEVTGKGRKYGNMPHEEVGGTTENQPETEDLKLKYSTVTDLTYLNQFCEGDKAKINKYIDMYLKAIPVFTERIEVALQTKDLVDIASQMHALKSKMLMMGMTNTRDLAQQIELQCKDDVNFTNIRINLNILLEQLSSSVEELNIFD